MANIGHQECHNLLMAVAGHQDIWNSLNGCYWPLREYTLFWWPMTTVKRVSTVSMAGIIHQRSTHSLGWLISVIKGVHCLFDGQYWSSRKFSLSQWSITATQESTRSLESQYQPSREYWLSLMMVTSHQDSMCWLHGHTFYCYTGGYKSKNWLTNS
jgi:hypothetical protein